MRPSWSNFTPVKRFRHRPGKGGLAQDHKNKLLGTVFALFLAAFSFSGISFASQAEKTPKRPRLSSTKVIMLVIDALSVDDFVAAEWTFLRRLAQGGAIGLMNSRSGATGALQRPAAYATIGAGSRAPAGSLSGFALDADEFYNGHRAAHLYASTTGVAAPDGGIVFLGVQQLQLLALARPEKALPGALGQQLAEKGVQVALIGNGDVPSSTDAGLSWRKDALLMRRYGALLAMDQHGQIPVGTVSSALLTFDETWPFRRRTDYEAVWQAFVSVFAEADFIVVELADFARLDALAEWIDKNRLAILRSITLRRIDEFVGRLAHWPAAAGAELFLVSPAPPGDALSRNFLLTPFLWTTVSDTVRSSEYAEKAPALASSATTRRAGLIANIDIAPEVLSLLTEATDGFVGERIQRVPLDDLKYDLPWTIPFPADSWQALSLLYERATTVHALRSPVIKTFVSGSIAVFVGWIVGTFYLFLVPVGRVSPAVLSLGRWITRLLCATPLAMLLVSFWPLSGPVSPTALLMALIALLAACSRLLDRQSGSVDGVVGLALVTAWALLIDVWTGARLIKSSVLGYDPIVGARFYGIGNEYMGVLIGMTLVGTTGLLDRFPGRRYLVTAVYIFYGMLCVTLAAPGLGANVGGTIAAVIGFGVTAVLLSDRPVTWRTFFVAFFLLAMLLGGISGLEALFANEKLSHLGRTFRLVATEGWQPFWDIVLRKLQMNVKLLQWTIWAQVFLVSLAVSAVALYRPGATLRRIESRSPMLLRGIRGAVVSAFVALIANDSGVVAAATMMIPVTATIMYLALLRKV